MKTAGGIPGHLESLKENLYDFLYLTISYLTLIFEPILNFFRKSEILTNQTKHKEQYLFSN